MFVTNLISIRVFVIIYRCFIRNYVMIFQNVILNLWGIDWWVVGCLMLGVDEMIRWLIKIVNNMSWYFICFLQSLND